MEECFQNFFLQPIKVKIFFVMTNFDKKYLFKNNHRVKETQYFCLIFLAAEGCSENYLCFFLLFFFQQNGTFCSSFLTFALSAPKFCTWRYLTPPTPQGASGAPPGGILELFALVSLPLQLVPPNFVYGGNFRVPGYGGI